MPRHSPNQIQISEWARLRRGGDPPSTSFSGFLFWFGFPFVGALRGVSHQRPWTKISTMEFGLSHFFPK
jgi:hypothetical protein